MGHIHNVGQLTYCWQRKYYAKLEIFVAWLTLPSNSSAVTNLVSVHWFCMGWFTKVQDQVGFFPFCVCVYKALALCPFLPVALLARLRMRALFQDLAPSRMEKWRWADSQTQTSQRAREGRRAVGRVGVWREIKRGRRAVGCGWGCEGRSGEEVQPTSCSLILQNSVPHIKLYSSPCLSLPQSCVITVD